MEVNPLASQPPKPWFLFLQGRHQGPFSMEDVAQKLTSGLIAADTFAWRAGMADWQPIGTIADLASTAAKPVPRDNPVARYMNEVSLARYEFRDEKADLARPLKATNRPRTAPSAVLPQPVMSTRAADPESPLVSRRQAIYAGLVLLGAIAVVWIGIWHWSGRRLPVLDDVAREEYRALQAALSDPLGTTGPSAALAISHLNPAQPFFYVASNLPEGSRFEVKIEGKPETLVDRFHVVTRAQISLHEGMARTPVLSEENGHAYPRGEYQISLQCLSCRALAANAVLASATYFVGGVADADYRHQLNAYHTQLKAQAGAELVELKQMAETLERQLHDTTLAFQRAGGSRKGRLKEWSEFHTTWIGMKLQMDLLSQGWTAQSFENQFYYGAHYRLLKEASELVGRIHNEQNEWVSNGRGDQSMVQHIAGDSSVAQSSLLAVQAKIILLERSAASNGMPPR